MEQNQGYTYREQLARSAQGRALADFLADRYRHSSKQDWIERIRQGRVSNRAHLAARIIPSFPASDFFLALLWMGYRDIDLNNRMPT